MHWNMAECSESAGRMWTPYCAASGSTYGPPAISVSLFARQISLPALMAATVGCRPAQPTMPGRPPRKGLRHNEAQGCCLDELLTISNWRPNIHRWSRYTLTVPDGD